MNRLVGSDPKVIVKEAQAILSGAGAFRRRKYWYNDGHAADRIVSILESLLRKPHFAGEMGLDKDDIIRPSQGRSKRWPTTL
jgi:hypothetical protein